MQKGREPGGRAPHCRLKAHCCLMPPASLTPGKPSSPGLRASVVLLHSGSLQGQTSRHCWVHWEGIPILSLGPHTFLFHRHRGAETLPLPTCP